MENIKEIFEKETKLKLRKRWDNNGYYEVSGIKYSVIKARVSKFNALHKTNVTCYDDIYKDVTTIYLNNEVC